MTQTLRIRQTNATHSADVRLELHTAGKILRPSHTASDWIGFDNPQIIAPDEARLRVIIDGVIQESIIRILPHTSPSDRIPVQILQTARIVEAI